MPTESVTPCTTTNLPPAAPSLYSQRHYSTTSVATNPHQRRNRAQSFSHGSRIPPGVRRSNLMSWPQSSKVHDIEKELSRLPPRRILFYDRQRPYYGFTNFSNHPVKYDGKTYPTSEHLFQSFKVSSFFCLILNFDENHHSFKIIDPGSLSTFGCIALAQVTLFRRPAASNPRFALTGLK